MGWNGCCKGVPIGLSIIVSAQDAWTGSGPWCTPCYLCPGRRWIQEGEAVWSRSELLTGVFRHMSGDFFFGWADSHLFYGVGERPGRWWRRVGTKHHKTLNPLMWRDDQGSQVVEYPQNHMYPAISGPAFPPGV